VSGERLPLHNRGKVLTQAMLAGGGRGPTAEWLANRRVEE